MLSISNISAIQASKYYEKDDYYARGDVEDRWQGKLKDELNLPNNLTKEDFDKLVKEKKELAGFDLCFSAPKSVSVAMCLSDDIKQDMIQAHNAAVKATLELIEQREIGTRVTTDKNTQHVKTGNMIAGLFNHYVSRNSDPQLHTHSVILNKTKYNDKWYSIDNPDLYKNKILYGQIYRNLLAKELLAKGYQTTITDVQKGFFELEGIQKETLDQFSSRRLEILEKLKEWKSNTSEAASKAAVMTRKAKEQKDMNVLTESWRETLSEMGGIQLKKEDAPILKTPAEQKEQLELAIKNLEMRSFAFKERDLKKAVLAAGVSIGMTEQECKDLLQMAKGNQLVNLGVPAGLHSTDSYYTTRKNLAFEKQIFDQVRNTKNTFTGMKRDVVEAVLKTALERDNTQLSDQQHNAVLNISISKDKYFAVQGLAGTGKTHMLNYTREVLEADGYNVTGACFTGKAAQGLQEDAHIPSQTIHSFLNQLEKEAGNRNHSEDMQSKTDWNLKGLEAARVKEAWVVDEASMVDNNTLRYLMKAAELKNAKVVFVGDRQQLLPVGVGNAFAVMTETNKIDFVKLDEIRRQKDAELLTAVRESVMGDTMKSFEILEKDVAIYTKTNDRMKAIVKEFSALSPKEQRGTVILTAGNKDRRTINEMVRKSLLKKGQLQTGTQFSTEDASGTTYKREFSIDDKVIFLQNDKKMGVRNGQTGYVKAVDKNIIVVESSGKEIHVDMKKYNKIDHGYTMTAHKAQGITTDRVLINLDSSQKLLNNRNAFYVDISRARYKARIFADDLVKIQKQVQEFAKKLTSEDFIKVAPMEKREPKKEETEIRRMLKKFKSRKIEKGKEKEKEHLKEKTINMDHT
jgi:conjugative relaxase-like TrwC/TraI family protein